jgi:hypothetical protein
MEGHAPDSALEGARAALRAEQGLALTPQSVVLPGLPVTAAAIERYRELTQVVPDEGTGRVRRGAFTFEPELEAERIARGEALIRRVDPGPHEDVNYFAMLAYQAASIEYASDDIGPGAFSRFLLGTAHAADVNAFSRRLGADDYTIVVLNTGLVDFVYQAAKVVVEAMHPTRTAGEERGLVRASTDLETIRTGLAADPAPINRLYRTLEAYFFNGYPRATAFETVPEEQNPQLSLVTGLAERWIIGHEYGHGVTPSTAGAPDEVNLHRAEEYFADTNAMIVTVLSAAKLDAVPPEFPLGGAIFALACLDLLRRGLYLLLTGDEHRAGGESDTHPAPRDRAATVINGFRQFFEVEYRADHLFDLRFAPKPEIPETHGFTRERSGDTYKYAEILQTVWSPVKERLLEDQRQQRPLHAMWQ